MKATHADTGDTVELLHAQESVREIRGDLTKTPVPGDDTGSVLLADLKASEGGTLTGIATANYLSNQSQFSDDRLTALTEYSQRLMLLVPIRPGTGWTLTDEARDEEINVVFKNVRWQRNEADPYSLQWSCEFDRGEGIGAADIPSPGLASPRSSATLDGVDLGALQSYSEKTEQETKVYELTLEDIGSNSITTKSGPVRTATIRGRPTGDARDEIDSKIESIKGADQTVTFESPTGEDYQVVVETYEGTREARSTELGEYRLTLVEGEV